MISIKHTKWVATWGVSPSVAEARPARYARDITLRYYIRSMLDGSKLRLHFSNFGESDDVSLTRVHVARAADDALATAAECVTVTFGGSGMCRIPLGTTVVSDEIQLSVARGEDIAVSIYIGDFTRLGAGVGCYGPLCRAHYAEGECIDAPELSAEHAMKMDNFFFLTEVDVLAAESAHALVAFGDSITAQSWPDWLALRVLENGPTNLAVVRRGIGGGRVLREYTHLQSRNYGPSGVERFEREVSAAGVDRVVVLHGVNDIIHPDGELFRPWSDLPTAAELQAGLEYYVRRGHELGLRVYLATIMPIEGWFSYTEARDVIREAVNAWIRGNGEVDGVIDFDAVARDPERPRHLLAACDSGDHLHPSLEGARRIANAVPLD